jgi:hypothetical protein
MSDSWDPGEQAAEESSEQETESECPPETPASGHKDQDAGKASRALSHLSYKQLCDIQCAPVAQVLSVHEYSLKV